MIVMNEKLYLNFKVIMWAIARVKSDPFTKVWLRGDETWSPDQNVIE